MSVRARHDRTERSAALTTTTQIHDLFSTKPSFIHCHSCNSNGRRAAAALPLTWLWLWGCQLLLVRLVVVFAFGSLAQVRKARTTKQRNDAANGIVEWERASIQCEGVRSGRRLGRLLGVGLGWTCNCATLYAAYWRSFKYCVPKRCNHYSVFRVDSECCLWIVSFSLNCF